MSYQSLLPVCVQNLVDDAEAVDDHVHQFVRLMAAHESLIKFIAAICHAGICEGSPPTWYAMKFRDGFQGRYPNLGDWNQIIADAAKYFRKLENRFLGAVLERVMRKCHEPASAIGQLCRHIDLARRSLGTIAPSEKFTAFQLFEKIVQLRNTYSHGALTEEFTKRYNALLHKSLDEVAVVLALSNDWELLIPLRLDPEDREKAIATDPDGSRNNKKSVPIGDRNSLPWDELHLRSPGGDLEDAISLGPLVRFNLTYRIYEFANGYSDGALEYLSYQTGDMQIDPGYSSWEECFGIPLPSTDVSDDIKTQAAVAVPTESSVSDVQPAVDDRKPISDVPQVVTVPNVESVVNAFVDFSDRHALKELLDIYEGKLYGLETEELIGYFTNLEAEIDKRDSPKLFGVLGALGLRIGLFENAASALERQLANGDQDKTVLQRSGRALLRWGADLKSMGKRNHKSGTIDRGKDVIKKGADRLEESLVDNGSDGRDRWHNVKSLSMLVDAYCKLGDFKKALEYCERGIQLAPESQRLNSQRLYLFERGAG